MKFDDSDQDQLKLLELSRQNEFLEHENAVLDSYLTRHLNRKITSEEELSDMQWKDEKNSRIRRARQHITLTLEQKMEICTGEMEHARKQLEDTKKTSERLIETLRAVSEETDLRIAEVKKDGYEFKRDVVVGADDLRTGKIIAEKIVKFLEEKLRQKDAYMEKLKLKNAALKGQIRTIDSQLRHKEEMGEVLHYIDFHQLQINNKQYTTTIEEKNQELLKLKQATGNSVQVLNQLKKKLKDLIEKGVSIEQTMELRKAANFKVTQETLELKSLCQKYSKQLDHLQSIPAVEAHEDKPNIMDHITQKAKLFGLKEGIKTYERKVEIAERALKLAQRQAKKLQNPEDQNLHRA